MTKDEALKMAIEQMNVYAHMYLCEHQCQDEELLNVIQACKEALKQQEVGDAEIKQMLNDIEWYQMRVKELEEELEALEQPAQEPVGKWESKCKCTFAQSLVGDGCRYCQPQDYIDRLLDDLKDCDKRIDELEA